MIKTLLILVVGIALFCTPIQSKDFQSYWMEVESTAYCPCSKCCGRHADGKTATGKDANKAGCAVDPKIIPLGSRIDIPGYERGSNSNGSWIEADDTGSAIKGKRIDVRFSSHKEALEWGRKTITIRVWKEMK